MGLLPEPDRAALEDRFFGEPELLDRIDETERDLIQAYLDDRLPPPERQAFESHFLKSGAARRKVEQARTVAEFLRRSRRRPRLFHLVLAGAFLLMSGAAAYLFLNPRRAAQHAIASIQQEGRRVPPEELAPWQMTQILTPGRQRSSGDSTAIIPIPAGAGLLRLKLEMTHDCQPNRCRAELTVNTGNPILVLPVLRRPDGLFVDIPASYLPPRADCLLELRDGSSKAESFQFSLKKISPPNPAH